MCGTLPRLPQLSRALAQRYDVLSAGAGALACTSFCVAQGQDPWTALSITAAATVSALVRAPGAAASCTYCPQRLHRALK